ncbi:chaperone NapD [Desulfobulbus sp. TB]|nr:chaperone NapD [Desulfobulbus sp. TB]
MNISGVVVQTPPERSESLQEQLVALAGVEIHAVNPEGSIVITVEDTPDNQPSEVLMQVQTIKGVLSASLIYNYCDD